MQLKIYLSSSYFDLVQYREKVYRELRSLRHDVIAMEDYVAADVRPLEKCLQDVRDCDVYVGIFAWRYGYVPLENNIEKRSVSELELREAERCGKPCLIFLLKETVPWPRGMMDATTGDNERGARIDTLRGELQKNRLLGLFETADELAAKVVTALYRWQMDSSSSSTTRATKSRQPSLAGAVGSPGKGLVWENGSRLRVRFMGGTQPLRQRIFRLVQLWGVYANIGLEPSDDDDAEVRVAFDRGGSWACEGTNCLTLPHDQPTVNFGWFDNNTAIDELERVVLHEFGHVLGLAHEHNNPEGEIKWNKETVYQDLIGPPNYWEESAIEKAMFQTWPDDRFPLRKPFDPRSIMAFPIPSRWTMDGFSIGLNPIISSADKEFISRLYPY
jgi:hypothetical protein